MLVQPVVMPGSGARSWTVLGDDGVDPAQKGGRAGGAGLLAGEPVVLAGGEVGEPGGHDRVVG